MGINYTILPVIRDHTRLQEAAGRNRRLVEKASDADIARWIATLAPNLDPTVEGRYPTPREIRDVLQSLAGLRWEVHVEAAYQQGGWQAAVSTYVGDDRYTYICIDGPACEYMSTDDQPRQFYFWNGDWHLNCLLAGELARVCGPLLFWPEWSDEPTYLLHGSYTPDMSHHNSNEPLYWTVETHSGTQLVRWIPGASGPSWSDRQLVPFPDPEYSGLPAYLHALGLSHPDPTPPGRAPTLGEIREVLASPLSGIEIAQEEALSGYLRSTVYIARGQQRCVATLWHLNDDDLTSQPIIVQFEYGDVYAEATILEQIAQRCGPQVLIAPQGSPVPLIVQAGDDPEQVVTAWERNTRMVEQRDRYWLEQLQGSAIAPW